MYFQIDILCPWTRTPLTTRFYTTAGILQEYRVSRSTCYNKLKTGDFSRYCPMSKISQIPELPSNKPLLYVKTGVWAYAR
jgi:hypothetical protein